MAPSELKVPDFAESVVEGTLLRWRKAVGEAVEQDEILVEVETDKVVLEIPSPRAGVLQARLREDGDRVSGGAVVGLVAAPIPVQPLLAQLTPVSAPRPREHRVPMSRLRQRIAERLLRSQAENASVVTFNEVNMQPLLSFIEQRAAAGAASELGTMPFFVKAAAHALRAFPILNASVSGQDIVFHEQIDIGVAVASARGLVVPVLRDADTLTLAQIDAQIRDFSGRAERGKLTLPDLEGGTFSISNGGVFGSMLSVPIINPPQSAILGVHAITRRPVAEGDVVVVRPVCYLALSYDHRIIDGREAVLGLACLKAALEDPASLWSQADGPLDLPLPTATTAPVEEPVQAVVAEAGATVLADLSASLAELLAVHPGSVAPDAQLVSLGLDSVLAVAWVTRLNQARGLAMPATVVYAHPTLQQLARHVERLQARATPAQKPASPAQRQEPVSASASASQATPMDDAVAIIGMSGRYAGADDLQTHWQHLREGRDMVVEVPAERWDVAASYDPRPLQAGKTRSKWLGALRGVDQFDPLFFGLSPAEAELMDPQQRLFMQEAYRALEDAGIAPAAVSGSRCGVYLGLCSNDYAILQRAAGLTVADRLGNSNAIASARIAYHLNLEGPAITVDTACSSSLVAMHMARQALLAGETDLALAGGASLYLAPELYVCWSGAGMLSPEGRCKTFDNAADGFVPGEGVGVVVLKRLRDAERDGDPILGVLLASGLNQDGRSNGITAPSMQRQTALVAGLYARHGIHARDISYVEAHGTGTKLGDPIELEALSTAFRADTDERGFCAIGSVKSAIGHTTAAAGVAGVHKVLLCLQHRQLTPAVNFRQPNEHFDFDSSPFYVNDTLRAWPAPAGKPRRAAVSSFGVSGTNAHLVIEEHRASARPLEDAPQPLLWALSAAAPELLPQMARRLAQHLRDHPALALADVACTLQQGRDAMEHRLAFVATGRAELLQQLDQLARAQQPAGVLSGRCLPPRKAVAVVAPAPDAALCSNPAALATLAQAWVGGASVDWRRLPAAQAARRVHLPTYPFANERCWIALPKAAPAVSTPLDLDFLDRLVDEVVHGGLDIEEAAARALS